MGALNKNFVGGCLHDLVVKKLVHKIPHFIITIVKSLAVTILEV